MQPVTAVLIVTWITAYGLQRFGGEATAAWMMHHLALAPEACTAALAEDAGIWQRIRAGITLVSHGWLHAGPLHLLVNILFTRVIAGRLEHRLGGLRMMLVFLASCAAGAVAQVLAASPDLVGQLPEWCAQDPATRVVGASAGLAGCLGAYLVFFPKARILLLIPVPIPLPVQLPLWVVIIAWVALQTPPVLRFLSPQQVDSVAWLAHLGGFPIGILLAPIVALGTKARRLTVTPPGSAGRPPSGPSGPGPAARPAPRGTQRAPGHPPAPR